MPYAKHKYFRIFHRYSNSLADLIMLDLTINAYMKLKRTLEFQKILHTKE